MGDDITDALKHLSKAMESLRDGEREAKELGERGAERKLFRARMEVSGAYTLLEELHYSLCKTYPNV